MISINGNEHEWDIKFSDDWHKLEPIEQDLRLFTLIKGICDTVIQ